MSQLYALEFFAFLAVVGGAVALLARWRRPLLLTATAVFAICASNEYVFVGLGVLAMAVFGAGRWLQARPAGPARTAVFVVTLAVIWTVTVLSARYDGLMALGALLEDRGWTFGLPLGSGIVAWASHAGVSFLALRMTCYLADSLFRPARLSAGDYLLYLFYFPAFLAGPVDRPWAFADKLAAWQTPARRQVLSGLDRLLTGLVKKFVVADILLPYTIAETTIGHASWWALAAGAVAYSLYIYWEFSGYTDIVLGASRVVGLELPENFDRPYHQTDPSAFWRCWHMSFSNWLRDYLFQPVNLHLARRLPALWAAVPALLTTMILCGLWHGYTVGFLLWGVHHGVGLAAHRLFQSWMPRRLGRRRYRELSAAPAYRRVCWAATFVYVTLGWIWFALPVADAAWVWRRLLGLA